MDNEDKSMDIPVTLGSAVLEVSDLEDSVLLVSVLLLSALLVSFLEDSSVLDCELSVLDDLSELSFVLSSDFSPLLSVLVTSLTTLDCASEISGSADSAAELSAEL